MMHDCLFWLIIEAAAVNKMTTVLEFLSEAKNSPMNKVKCSKFGKILIAYTAIFFTIYFYFKVIDHFRHLVTQVVKTVFDFDFKINS